MDLLIIPAVVAGLALVVMGIQVPYMIRGFRLGRKKGSFNCTSCGNCCRLRIISVTKEDIKRLNESGKKDFTDSTGRMMKRVNGRCVFLKARRSL